MNIIFVTKGYFQDLSVKKRGVFSNKMHRDEAGCRRSNFLEMDRGLLQPPLKNRFNRACFRNGQIKLEEGLPITQLIIVWAPHG